MQNKFPCASCAFDDILSSEHESDFVPNYDDDSVSSCHSMPTSYTSSDSDSVYVPWKRRR